MLFLMRKEKDKIRISKKLKLILCKNKIGRETFEDVIWRLPDIINNWDIKKKMEKKNSQIITRGVS